MVYASWIEEVSESDTREEYPCHAKGYALNLYATKRYTRGNHRRKDKDGVCYRGVCGIATTHHDSLKPLKIHYYVFMG